MQLQRKENAAPIKFTDYVNSPLGMLLAGILAKIEEVKNKYPHDPQAAELTNTERLIASIETMLKSLHEKILPQFDQGKEPGEMAILYMLKDIQSMQEIFVADNFKITNPMMFELALEMARLFMIAPKTLEKIVPFFNPKALAVNLHNGTAGWAMQLAANRTIILKQDANQDDNKLSYAYKVTQYNNKILTEKDQPYDGALYFANYFQYVFSLLIGEINKFTVEHPENAEIRESVTSFLRVAAQHYQEFANTPDVENELARSRLLQAYVNEESADILHKMAIVTANVPPVNLAELSGAGLIRAINQEINRIQLLEIDIAQIEHTLIIKKGLLQPEGNSPVLSFEQLLLMSPYQNLAAQLKADSDHDLNTAYSQSPLPTAVLGFAHGEEAAQIVSVKTHLVNLVDAQHTILNEHKEQLQAKILELTAGLQHAVAAWIEAERQTCEHRTRGIIGDLASIQRAFEELNASVHERLVGGQNIAGLQHTLETIDQKNERLVQLRKALIDTEAFLHKSSEISQKSDNQHDNDALQAYLNQITTPLLRQAEDILRQLHHTETVLTEKKQILEHNLAHAQMFEKNSREADPVKMRTALAEKNRALQSMSRRKTDLIKEQESLQLQVIQQQQRIEEINAAKKVQQMCMDGHTEFYRKQILSALAIIEPDQMEPRQTAQRLLSEEGNLKQWLQTHLDHMIAQLSEDTQGVVTANNYQEISPLLLEVEPYLESDKQDKLLIKEIETLESLKPKHSQKAPQGLERLLCILGFSESEIKDWKAFQSRDNSWGWLSSKPSAEEYTAHSRELSERIESKKAELMKIHELSKIISAIADQDRQKTATERDLAAENLKFTSANRSLESLSQQHSQKRQEILECDTQIVHSTASLAVFERSIGALEAILRHRGTIDQYMSLDATFGSEDSDELYPNLLTLNNQQSQLESTITQIEEANAVLSDPLRYQVVLQAIRQILAATNEQINDALEVKFAYIRGEIAELNDEITNFEQNVDNLRTDAEINEAAAALNERKNEIDETLSALQDQVADEEIDAAKNYLGIIEDELMTSLDTTAERINVAILRLNYPLIPQRITTFIVDSNQLFEQIKEDYNTVINNVGLEYNNFITDIDSFMQRNNVLLNTIEAQEAALANLHQNANHQNNAEVSNPIDVKIQELSIFKNNILQFRSLLSRSRDNSELRFNKVQEYTGKLSIYLAERNIRCKDKDRISSTDKDNRTNYVTKLKKKMAKYARTGDNTKLLNTLQDGLGTNDKGKVRFPGFHLRSLLNKALVEILNVDSVINLEPVAAAPVEGNDNADAIAIPNAADIAEHDGVVAAIVPPINPIEDILVELANSENQAHKNYESSIRRLYANIDDMTSYAATLADSPGKTTATDLANNLRQDLNEFVRSHPEIAPDPDARYQAFKTKFTAKLHSQDDSMCTLRSSGSKAGAIIANIAAGVFTLGIALGIKLLVTKVSTGRFALFFDKTTIQQKIESVDNSMATLDLPAAAPAA